MAKRLRAAGYRVRLQDVPFPIFRERSRPRLEVGGRRIPVRSLSYSPPGRVRAALARAGCGCRSADFDSARGRIALVERGVCTFRVKARLAQAAGARALVVGDRGGESAPSGSLARPGIRIPAVAAGAAGPALRGQALMVVDTVAETRRTRNVIAERPGPPARRVAMLGAHLDSVRHVDSLGGAERRRIAGYINLDMVGSPNPVRYVYGEGPVREALEQALRRRKLAFDEITIGASSDHAPFEDAGISVGGVYSGSDERKSARQARAYGGRAGRPLDACYHRRCDTLDRVDEKVLAELANVAGRALLAIE